MLHFGRKRVEGGWLTANEPGGPRLNINHDTEAVLTESRYFFHHPRPTQLQQQQTEATLRRSTPLSATSSLGSSPEATCRPIRKRSVFQQRVIGRGGTVL